MLLAILESQKPWRLANHSLHVPVFTLSGYRNSGQGHTAYFQDKLTSLALSSPFSINSCRKSPHGFLLW